MSVGAADLLAAVATAAGTLVLLVGLVRAAASPADAGTIFARGVLLALEFFLAAGLLRLGHAATDTALATTAAIVATRALIARTLSPIAHESRAPRAG